MLSLKQCLSSDDELRIFGFAEKIFKDIFRLKYVRFFAPSFYMQDTCKDNTVPNISRYVMHDKRIFKLS